MVVSASHGARYGKDFKQFTFTVTPKEHTECKLRAIRFGVTVADVCRLALLEASKDVWQRAKAARLKAKGE